MNRTAPLAHSFELAACSDPKCGPHIIALDKNDKRICEIVMSRRQGLALIKTLQALLYEKAVDHD